MITEVIDHHSFPGTKVTIIAKDRTELDEKKKNFGFPVESQTAETVQAPDVSSVPGSTKTLDIAAKLETMNEEK